MIDFKHLAKAKMSYFKHLAFAIRQSAILVWIAFVSIVHGLFPFVAEFYCARKILEMAEMLKKQSFYDNID